MLGEEGERETESRERDQALNHNQLMLSLNMRPVTHPPGRSKLIYKAENVCVCISTHSLKSTVPLHHFPSSHLVISLFKYQYSLSGNKHRGREGEGEGRGGVETHVGH